jgi:hypothetical protein
VSEGPQKLIPLEEWGHSRYSPPPSLWTLRAMVRAGKIQPRPEKVGKGYYVHPDATVIDPRRPAPRPQPAPVQRVKPQTRNEWLQENWRGMVVDRETALAGAVPIFGLPWHSGVYLIVEKDRSGVAYVGSSVNMGSRGRQHESRWADDAIAFPIAVPEDLRLGIEGAYIAALKPRMNTRSPVAVNEEIVEAIKEAWKGKV